jgi:hypothetical protein
MSKTTIISPLRQRMIEDMTARNLGHHSQRSHIYSCKLFAAFLKRSPDTANADDVRRFQLHLMESGHSIINRNRIMTGVKFLFRVTLRRHDLAAEIYHLREPQKLPLTMSINEAERLLAMTGSRSPSATAVGFAPVRSSDRPSQSRRHRQRADDHPHRAIERAQGPARHAAGRAASIAARVVEGAPNTL